MMNEYPRRRDHDGINGTREWASDRVTANYREYKGTHGCSGKESPFEICNVMLLK